MINGGVERINGGVERINGGGGGRRMERSTWLGGATSYMRFHRWD